VRDVIAVARMSQAPLPQIAKDFGSLHRWLKLAEAAEEAAREQVADREDHPAMIPAQQAAQARSSNQALQGPIE
jgi:hypothetical protein